jgi:methyltransferase (TIGR00027 family)
MRRAAHQLVDNPLVFVDPLAVRIVGGQPTEEQRAVMMEREQDRPARALRAFMAVRSRYAEDSLAEAVGRGVGQYVLLGAGLDTFAYRNPYGDRVRVFEVDHPATQAWKKECLQEAGIEPPATMTFAPVNFERQTVLDGLLAAGFRADQPAFVAWLGVTMYLARETVMAMFKTIADLPKPAGVVFDYGLDRELLGVMERMYLDAFAARVAAAGEPWITFFRPDELVAELRALGFNEIDDLSPDRINERYFKDRADGLRVGTVGHLMRANSI